MGDVETPSGVDDAAAFIEKGLIAEEQLIEQFEKHNLAEWVPNTVVERCKILVNRMSQWGYKERDIDEWMDRFDTIGEEESGWFYPAEYPSGDDLDSDVFTGTVGELSHYRWACDLEAGTGLRILSGKHAAEGYKNIEGRKKRTYKRSRLTRLIITTICRLTERKGGEPPSAKDVISNLGEYDDPQNPTIEDIDRDEIGWVNDRGHGEKTEFGTLPSKISRLKKDIRNKKVNCGMG